jgi:outer membrane immunogenic protein
MRRNFLLGIGLLASVAAGAGSALAADLPVRPPPAVAPVTCCAVPDWAGFYLGIHGGGGWGHTSFERSQTFIEIDEEFPVTLPPNASPKGGVFGFQFGHNWQWGPVVGGLEIDYSGADIKESTTFFSPFLGPTVPFTRDIKIDALASARGRLGYLILPNWLLYGTAGIGWGHSRITQNVFEENTLIVSDSSFFNEFGWVAGVGLEWKFWPGSNSWLLRGEWLHYDFARNNGSKNFLFFETVFHDTGNPRTTVDVARAAISYKF